MTTIRTWPDHLLTLAEWDALPEDTSRRFELVEGVLLVAPRPTPRHQLVAGQLVAVLDAALRPAWRALIEIELTIDDTEPPTVRAPDVTVVRAQCVDDRPRVVGPDVLAVVEVLSPGTRRIDRVAKLAEYAEIGIPHYLLVDPTPPVSLTEFALVQGAYRLIAEHRRQTTIDLGVPVSLDLDALL